MCRRFTATSCGLAIMLASGFALAVATSRSARTFETLVDTPRGVGAVTLEPIKDNTLYSESGSRSNGAGQHLFVGRTNGSMLRRSVLAFDIAGSVPPGSRITEVSLTLNLSRSFTSRDLPVSVFRLLADWGEGASNASGQEGAGAPAETNDATWTYRFFDTVAWITAGGDYPTLNSAALSVGGVGAYTWSGNAMISDVQQWLDDPATNFGWIILGEERSDGSAKRFDSRDHPTATSHPVLRVHYGGGERIVVNTTIDGNDADPGDGVCETSAGNGICPLRAAIEETNVLPGRDTIQLPGGTHVLDLTGSGEDAAHSGDLDVTDFLDLVGDGASRTFIDGSGVMDRVLHIVGTPVVQVSGVTLLGGSEDVGGGIWNLGTLVVRDSTIRDSTADLGSALCNDGGTVSVLGSTIAGNVAAVGHGAVENLAGGTMTLSNSTISGNTGNGLFNAGSSSSARSSAMDLNNVTVAENTEFGIHNADGSATIELSNTLIAGNSAGSCSGEVSSINSLGYNLDDDDTCGLSASGDLVQVDALLGTLQDNGGSTHTQALSSGSPAIDAANPATENDRPCEVTDQRGVLRPQGPTCDIGAFEADAVTNRPPIANAGEDSSAECSSSAGGMIRLDGSGSSDPDGNDDIVLFEWFLDYAGGNPHLIGTGVQLEAVLPLGDNVVTCRVTDTFGASDTADVSKTVEDSEPPTITVAVHPGFLWPPNNRMVPIEVDVTASDLCSTPTVVLESITSNEANRGGVAAAEMGSSDFDFLLRAQRNGAGDGRVYTIVYTAIDQAKQSSSGRARVVVPHDMGRRSESGAGGRGGRAD